MLFSNYFEYLIEKCKNYEHDNNNNRQDPFDSDKTFIRFCHCVELFSRHNYYFIILLLLMCVGKNGTWLVTVPGVLSFGEWNRRWSKVENRKEKKRLQWNVCRSLQISIGFERQQTNTTFNMRNVVMPSNYCLHNTLKLKFQASCSIAKCVLVRKSYTLRCSTYMTMKHVHK